MSLGPDDHGRWLRQRFGTPPARSVPSQAERERQTRIANEQTKLTAAFVNAFAIAFVVLGLVRPYLDGASDRDWITDVGIGTAGVGLHVLARFVLHRLRRE